MSAGARLEGEDWPWLASLLLVGCLVLGAFALNAQRFTEGQGGVPLDDAWIHFQFARNLARGDGLSFNPGHPTSGSTAPLWTLLLAAVYIVGGRFPVTGQLLSGVCYLALLVATYALGKRLTGRRWTAWLAGAVVAANGRLAWAGLSALETCLFAALSMWAIGAHLSDWTVARYRPRTAILFGLAALSRPEGYLLFALAMLDFSGRVWRQLGEDADSKAGSGSRVASHIGRRAYLTLRRALLPVILFAAIVLPYLLFSLRTSGHLLPNTYHAKAGFDFRPDIAFLSVGSKYLVLDNVLLLPFFLLGLIMLPFKKTNVRTGLVPRAPLLSLWAVGLPLVYAFMHAVLYQHGRYLIPLIPCNAVISMVGLMEMGKLARRRGWRWLSSVLSSNSRSVALVSALVVAATAWRLPAMARLYAWNVDNINEMHVELGHWVAQNTPPDAILALNDIGAITYISEREIVDLAGLVTPEVIPLLRSPDRDARLIDLMAQRDVAYVVIFPNWFPRLAARRDVLEPVHQVVLERNTIAGGSKMIVYRAHWRR